MNVAILTIGLVFLLNSTFAIQEESGINIYKNCHEDLTSCSESLDLERSVRSTTQNHLEWLPTILNVILFGGPELLKGCLFAMMTLPCFEPFNTVFNFIGGPKCADIPYRYLDVFVESFILFIVTPLKQ